MKRPSGKDLGGYRKRGWWTLAPWLWCSLGPHSVCKKSPNLLAPLLPLPDLNLKQWQRVVQSCADKGGFPGAIRPKKEYIIPCETCFAKNVLSFLIRVQAWNEFVPQVLWPFNYLTLTQNKPWVLWMLSIIWSFLPDNDWWALLVCVSVCMDIYSVFLFKLNPIKSCWGTGSWLFSFERSATFPPQADHVLVDLFSSVAARGASWAEPPHNFCSCTWLMRIKCTCIGEAGSC